MAVLSVKKITILTAMLLLLAAANAAAQGIAIVVPDGSEQATSFVEGLSQELTRTEKVLDNGLALTAFSSAAGQTPFNMTIDQARNAGRAIGCEFYILIRSATLRRSSFQRAEYYEAFAAVFVVSTRTGRLVHSRLKTLEEKSHDEARKRLFAAIPALAQELTAEIRKARRFELAMVDLPFFPEVPEPGTAAAKGFRAPVPYRRLKPEYTREAALHNIVATVDAMVFLEATGEVSRVEIDRWAGFGLDASVESAIRSMNWRPAERDGKAIAVRFLVRYNFKNVE